VGLRLWSRRWNHVGHARSRKKRNAGTLHCWPHLVPPPTKVGPEKCVQNQYCPHWPYLVPPLSLHRMRKNETGRDICATYALHMGRKEVGGPGGTSGDTIDIHGFFLSPLRIRGGDRTGSGATAKRKRSTLVDALGSSWCRFTSRARMSARRPLAHSMARPTTMQVQQPDWPLVASGRHRSRRPLCALNSVVQRKSSATFRLTHC
jgi:hypothetical protein